MSTVLLPQHVRAARGLLDWNQDQLSEKSGVSKSTIHRFEKGNTISQNNIQHLHKTLTENQIEITDDGQHGFISLRLTK